MTFKKPSRLKADLDQLYFSGRVKDAKILEKLFIKMRVHCQFLENRVIFASNAQNIKKFEKS